MKYFVKLAGKAFGPLEEEKIIEMYQAGRLKDPVEISRDKSVWDLLDNILPKSNSPEPLPVEFLENDGAQILASGNSVPSVSEAPPPIVVDPDAPVWFYSIDGRNGYGPVSKSNVASMLQCNMLKPSSLVWRQGENSRPISIVPELSDILVSNSFTASSIGSGGDIDSIPPLPDIPYNDALSSNSIQNLGIATHSSAAGNGINPRANMFDLLDDPGYGNDGFSQDRPSSHSQVGQVSRMSYVLMAIFLGQLGIHNFYARRMDIAIVQLFVGLSNLVGLIIISFVSLATEGEARFLFIIPALVGFGLELWAIIETCVVTKDGIGKRMY